MKKYIIILIITIILTGCSKEKESKEMIIKSTGGLECNLTEERTYDNSLYSSNYVFNYEDGSLVSVVNIETLNVSRVKNKDTYSESYIKERDSYKGMNGIVVEDLSNDDIYSIKVTYDIKKMDKDIIKEYSFDLDRINMYKEYSKAKYKCN